MGVTTYPAVPYHKLPRAKLLDLAYILEEQRDKQIALVELGWAVGAGKRTAILLEDPVEPELMYRMVDHISPSLFDLLGWLGVED